MPTKTTPKTPAVSFANLICRFGDQFVLLDFASEIVIPAFTDYSLKRKFGDTTYFFFRTGITEIPAVDQGEQPTVILYGRIVKDTLLTREQVYEPGTGLVPNVDSMPSAPSSFFVVILNNHKLVYVPETTNAPSLGVFGTTLQKFVTIRYTAYIEALHERLKLTPEPKPKRQLYQEIPHPTVEVLPLASKASIEEFLKAFDKVTHLEFKILETNAEFQMQQTYEELRRMKRSIRATSTRLVHHSAGGLDKENAIEQIQAAAASGNEKVVLSGKSADGLHLSGDNHNFKMSVHPEALPEKEVDRAVRLVELYAGQVESGIILEDVAADSSDKIRKIREQLPDE